MTPAAGEGRRGAALVTAILLSLAGVLLAHGALVLARAELSAARTSARVLRLEYAARGAAQRALDAIAERNDAPGVSDSLSLADGRGSSIGRFARLSAELWWVEGEAREGAAARRGGLPLWRLDPRTRARALPGVVVTGGSSPAEGVSRVDATAYAQPSGPSPPGGCTTGEQGESPGPRPAPWHASADSAGVSLGLLSLASLERRAELRVAGIGTPGPRERGGACTADPWNWGDPGGSARVCGDRIPLVRVAPGTVALGGVGQGILISPGDIELRDTEYHGLVLADGAVRLEGRAHVTGGIVARGGISIGSHASVRASRCWLEAVLVAAPLRRPSVIRPVRWIPLGG